MLQSSRRCLVPATCSTVGRLIATSAAAAANAASGSSGGGARRPPAARDWGALAPSSSSSLADIAAGALASGARTPRANDRQPRQSHRGGERQAPQRGPREEQRGERDGPRRPWREQPDREGGGGGGARRQGGRDRQAGGFGIRQPGSGSGVRTDGRPAYDGGRRDGRARDAPPHSGPRSSLIRPPGAGSSSSVEAGLKKWGVSSAPSAAAPATAGRAAAASADDPEAEAAPLEDDADLETVGGSGRVTDAAAPASARASAATDERHGRNRERISRSLLRPADAAAAAPGADRHRRGKDRDRDRRLRSFGADDGGAPAAAGAATSASQAQYEAKKLRQRVEKSKREGKGHDEKREVEVYVSSTTSVAQLAEKFGVKLGRLQRKMSELGMSDEQQRASYLLNADEACNLAIEFDLNPIVDDDRGFDIYPVVDDTDVASRPLRPPVVAIMGHVDHGKTTLLDALRHTSVAAGEAGGITQHIGAFSVPLASLAPDAAPAAGGAGGADTITFLDTPGHAAFTGMRARGAHVTDLVVLVVAADDGVMPQTREVLALVKAEGDKVGLVVAINKCDKPAVDIDRVKSALGAEGIHLEEDGGDVPGVRVSGLARTGLDSLVETLATLAEVRDLRASRDGQAQGVVLESRVDKGRGNVATVLVTRGTLRAGASLVAGTTWCRVRQMADSAGRAVREAAPGTPVSLTGWKDLPAAGDALLEAGAGGEDAAKKCVANRRRDAERRRLAADLDAINARRAEERLRAAREAAAAEQAKAAGDNVAHAVAEARRRDEAAAAGSGGAGAVKELRLVIKGDVSGTVEAVVGSLEGIGNSEAKVKIVHTGVGDVAESDVALAEAAGATVIGFSVACPRAIQTAAAASSVPLLLDSVIYRLIDAVRARVAALLPPRIEHRVTGEAVVQQLFEIKLSRREVKVVAGCRVANGVISKAEGARVLRGPGRDVVHEGPIETLKHLKKDVTEVRKGTECGIALEGFADIQEGDEIVTFQKIEVAREL